MGLGSVFIGVQDVGHGFMGSLFIGEFKTRAGI